LRSWTVNRGVASMYRTSERLCMAPFPFFTQREYLPPEVVSVCLV
jgi:hypothetical protein